MHQTSSIMIENNRHKYILILAELLCLLWTLYEGHMLVCLNFLASMFNDFPNSIILQSTCFRKWFCYCVLFHVDVATWHLIKNTLDMKYLFNDKQYGMVVTSVNLLEPIYYKHGIPKNLQRPTFFCGGKQ